jgi:hypothetical protein
MATACIGWEAFSTGYGIMRDPKKKCIAKKCEDCNFYQYWNMVDDKGNRRVEIKCSMQVLFDEIPRIRGSIDGCQTASNETRNTVIEFSEKAVKTIKGITQFKLIGGSK